MDENVLYNPPGSTNKPVQPPSGVPPMQPPPTTPPPNSLPPQQPPPPAQNQSFQEPSLAGNFMGGGFLKKFLIGIGVIILITFLIILLLPKGASEKPVTLQWWGLWEDSSTVQPLITDFKATHPTITIQYIKNDPDQYRERLLTRIQNGTGPDIFMYHNTWFSMLSDNLSPLSSDVITPDEFKTAYYPVVQQDLTKNGAIYGIPLGIDSLALFVNPSLLASAGVQVPSTWDDFIKAAKQLTVKDSNGKIKTAGAALGTYSNITHAPDIISLLFLQQGVQLHTIAASTQNESDALKFYTAFALGDNNVWDATLDNSLLAFSKGNLAMYFGYSWDIFAIQKLNPQLQFRIYPVPNLYGKKTTVASYWANGVSVKSPNQKAAMEFMHYLAQKSTAQKFYTEAAKTRAFGEPYARKDLQSSLKDNALVYPFVSQLDNASSSYFASDTHDGDTGLNSVMNNYLQTAINSIVNDGNSPDSAVNDLNNGITQVLQKYGQ